MKIHHSSMLSLWKNRNCKINEDIFLRVFTMSIMPLQKFNFDTIRILAYKWHKFFPIFFENAAENAKIMHLFTKIVIWFTSVILNAKIIKIGWNMAKCHIKVCNRQHCSYSYNPANYSYFLVNVFKYLPPDYFQLLKKFH